MIGAILGDIIGSPYEFDCNNIKSKEFPLFTEQSHFTDDTVMTIAVAEGLLKGDCDKEKTKTEIIKSMRELGRLYPYAGYGDKFADWLYSDNPQPYNSFGNGSAMRVSAVGWLYDDLDTVLEYAELTASVTHNHPEGIKGAQAVAAAIFLARNETSKNDIRKFIEERFEYDLSKSCDEIRPTYRHVESCQETVPQAITAFLEGTSFEDVIRTAVSLGGDSDTLAAIAGSIAEAYDDDDDDDVPDELSCKAANMLSSKLFDILYEVDLHIYFFPPAYARKSLRLSEVILYIVGFIFFGTYIVGVGFEIYLIFRLLFDNSVNVGQVMTYKNYITIGVGLLYQITWWLWAILNVATGSDESEAFLTISSVLLLVATWFTVCGLWIN